MPYRLPFVLTLLAASAPASASACATCGCGDPTFTVMGTEAPFAGRLRLAVRTQYRWDAIGEPGVDRAEVHEAQLVVGASWAPLDRLVLSAEMPILLRHVRWASLAHATVVGPGELELRARWIVLRDRPLAAQHLLGAHTGVKLPTAPDQIGADGQRLPVEAQTGTGTVDPILGLFYSHFADPFSLFVSASVSIPLAGRYDEAPGPSLRATVAVQHRFDRWLSARLGADVRLDAPARIFATTDPRSDHFALFASPDILWSPVADLVIGIGVRVPLVQVSELAREEGWYVATSIVGDV